jgi:general secretion pathway protein G
MPKLFVQKGFTLIEMLITITIVSVISVIAASTYRDYTNTTKISLAITQIRTLSLVIDGFYLDNGYYPNSLEEVNNSDFLDPWGNKYIFLNFHNSQGADLSGNHHMASSIGAARKDHNLVPINSNYDLYSIGKDGMSKPPLTVKVSEDDVIYANDGAYVGLARFF